MEQVFVVSTILQWVVLLFTLFLCLALVRRINTNRDGSAPTIENLKQGEAAPNFTAEMVGGGTVTLADFARRAVALIFVSPDCVHCRRALPSYEAVKDAAAAAGTEIVLVSTANQQETLEWIEEQHIKLPMLLAPAGDNSFAKDYKAEAVPTYCLINENGVVEASGYPSTEWGGWMEQIEAWNAVGNNQREKTPVQTGEVPMA